MSDTPTTDGATITLDTSRPFARTSCSCGECVQCCHEQPGSLAAGELERIAAHLQLPVRVAALKFWASPGGLAMNTATGERFRIGTITPRLKHGRCVFLDAEERCTIHAVAPAGCALFDTHMSGAEGQPRSLWLMRSQQDAGYQSLRRTLVEATSHAPRSY
jgi:Fe-S-cluster containining protein